MSNYPRKRALQIQMIDAKENLRQLAQFHAAGNPLYDEALVDYTCAKEAYEKEASAALPIST
jgi:hypothetical protein